MGVIFDYLLVDVFAVLCAFTVGLFTYVTLSFNYWKNRKVPFASPQYPYGAIKSIVRSKVSIGQTIKDIYCEYKAKGCKHVGIYIFTKPIYLAIDPKYIKSIMATDFDTFPDHGNNVNFKHDPLSRHLFNMSGDKWKRLRTKLNPMHSSAKLKVVFDTLLECGDQLLDALNKLYDTKEPINATDMMKRYTTDVIGSIAFGVACNSLKDPDGEFVQYTKKILNSSKRKILKRLMLISTPRIARWLKLVTTRKDVREFFLTLVKDTIDYRETNNASRKDLMQVLIELKNEKNDDPTDSNLTIEEIASQVFLFFIAGFETTGTGLIFACYQLALNIDLQTRAREEVNAIYKKYDGKMTYDSFMEMTYLKQIIDETLRLHPPVYAIARKSVKPYKIPDTDVVLDEGTTALLPIMAVHHDAEYYPDPLRFDPERFSEENKKNLTPNTYFPFGQGPRICIGLRFAIMEMRIALSTILRNFNFTLNDKTNIPLRIQPHEFLYVPKDIVWLNMEKIDCSQL